MKNKIFHSTVLLIAAFFAFHQGAEAQTPSDSKIYERPEKPEPKPCPPNERPCERPRTCTDFRADFHLVNCPCLRDVHPKPCCVSPKIEESSSKSGYREYQLKSDNSFDTGLNSKGFKFFPHQGEGNRPKRTEERKSEDSNPKNHGGDTMRFDHSGGDSFSYNGETFSHNGETMFSPHSGNEGKFHGGQGKEFRGSDPKDHGGDQRTVFLNQSVDGSFGTSENNSASSDGEDGFGPYPGCDLVLEHNGGGCK